MIMRQVLFALLVILGSPPASAQTPEQWIAIGTQVHGGFGTYIVLGIRIGQDALKVLEAKPRELDVTLVNGPKAPCPCIIDGVMIATSASPGQGTLRVAPESAAADELGIVVVRHQTTGRTVRYVIPASSAFKLAEWNKTLDPKGRFEAVMQEPEQALFVRDQR